MTDREPVKVGVYIPPEILHRKGLNDRQKLVLASIVQLYQSKRSCYASNAHFEQWFGVPKKEVSVTISLLARKDLLKVAITYKGKQVIRRDLTPNLRSLRIQPKRMVGLSRISGEGIP
ncbi:MAG: helix-turn-helix domain-containing protein [Planctomycetaceae bacterium]|nr:helix-turn-helix domain-containing protein [Planctomycetaceae bacterium]